MAVLAADGDRGAALRLLDEAQRLGLPPTGRLYTGAAAALAAAAGAGRPQGPRAEAALVATAGLSREMQGPQGRGRGLSRPTKVQVLLAQGAVGRAVASVLTLLDDFIARRKERRSVAGIRGGVLAPLSLQEVQALLAAAALTTAAGARDDLTAEVLRDYAGELGALAEAERALVGESSGVEMDDADGHGEAGGVDEEDGVGSRVGVDSGAWAAIREH